MPVPYTLSVDVENVTNIHIDYTGDVAYGVPYTSMYSPTIPVIRDSAGKAVLTGRFILDTIRMEYEETAHIKATITDRYGSAYEQVYDFGDMPFRTIGDINSNMGTFIIHAYIDADEAEVQLSTDKHYEMRFTSMQWTGSYSKSTRRV